MKINRTENAARNMVFGIILKVYQIAVPFLMRTAMIYFLGVEYLGLNSLFASVLQVLNLAELGVGSAMVYSMYKPISVDDKTTICALMKLYRLYYRIIGGAVLLLGLCLLPFIDLLIKGDIPNDVNLYVLYIINLAATVLSYWLFAYKNSVLQAHQRTDITSKVTIITDTVKYILQIAVLVFFKNYYYYLIVVLLSQCFANIFTAVYADRLYPQYKPYGSLKAESIRKINSRIRDLFTSKIGTVIVYSADSIVISAFLGLTVLAVYQNYYYIISAVMGIISVIFASCTAGIGNSIIVESQEKNFDDFKNFTFITVWISGFCSACFLCLFQPFMYIWMGDTNLMLSMSIVVCFAVYFFVMEVNALLNLYKDAAGMWREDRMRPLATALTNLGLNLISVNFMGLYGIILSTVFSIVFVGMPWILNNLFTVIFDRRFKMKYIFKLIKYVFVVFAVCSITYFACCFIIIENIWLQLIAKAVLCCILPNILFYAVFRNCAEFHSCILLLDRMTGGRFTGLFKRG